MTTWELTLKCDKPPLSLNDRGQTPGAHRVRDAKAAKLKAEVAELAADLPVCESVHVRLHWQPAVNRRRDADNLMATFKPCADGLVTAGVVPDDCLPFLDWSRPQIHPPVKGEPARMWLEIEDTSATGWTDLKYREVLS